MNTESKNDVTGVPLARLVVLLPCPFCGSEAKTYCGTVTCSRPSCKMHFAAVPDMHTAEEWNTRACPECNGRGEHECVHADTFTCQDCKGRGFIQHNAQADPLHGRGETQPEKQDAES